MINIDDVHEEIDQYHSLVLDICTEFQRQGKILHSAIALLNDVRMPIADRHRRIEKLLREY